MSKDAAKFIYLHVSPFQKALIDRAAEALSRSRSDFILEMVCQKATAELLDKNFLLLDEQRYKRFTAVLDKSPAENSRLRQLLVSQAAWETDSLKEISPPEPLGAEHDIAAFDCGVADLNEWLKNSALAHEEADRARTYVVCARPAIAGQVSVRCAPSRGRVVGYYALGTGAVAQGTATGDEWDNMPDPVPVALLGRLAVDRSWQGRGIGRGLLRDMVLRALQESKNSGFRAVLVQARNERVKQFHEHCGFTASSIEPMTLMFTVAEARDIIRALQGGASGNRL